MSRSRTAIVSARVALALIVVAAAACSTPEHTSTTSSSSSEPAPPQDAAQCGTVTSAQLDIVPVTITTGTLDCAHARDIASQYFDAMLHFQGHNSGYALVEDWTCNSAIRQSPTHNAPIWICTVPTATITIGPP